MACSALNTACQGMASLRRATLTNSFRACTPTLAPPASNFAAAVLRGSSSLKAYRRTLESRKALSLIGVIPIELEIGRKGNLQITDLPERLSPGHAGRDLEFALACHANFNLVSRLELQRGNQRCGKS